MLGSSEDNTALSRALSQLAEVEEKIEQLHHEQANNDFFLLAELLGDYIRLLSVVRVRTPLLPLLVPSLGLGMPGALPNSSTGHSRGRAGHGLFRQRKLAGSPGVQWLAWKMVVRPGCAAVLQRECGTNSWLVSDPSSSRGEG